MMGEPVGRQDRLFYEFDLEDMVPAGHLLRRNDLTHVLRRSVEVTPQHPTFAGRCR